MPARHLSRLPRPDRAERGRRARDRHGALGQKSAAKLEAKGKLVFQAAAAIRARQWRDEHPQHLKQAWAATARPRNRCLVPFTSFSEYDTIDGKKVVVWFAINETRPMLAFAGIWTNWTCTAEVYGFLTCQPNAEVGKVLATDGRLML